MAAGHTEIVESQKTPVSSILLGGSEIDWGPLRQINRDTMTSKDCGFLTPLAYTISWWFAYFESNICCPTPIPGSLPRFWLVSRLELECAAARVDDVVQPGEIWWSLSQVCVKLFSLEEKKECTINWWPHLARTHTAHWRTVFPFTPVPFSLYCFFIIFFFLWLHKMWKKHFDPSYVKGRGCYIDAKKASVEESCKQRN